MKVGWLTVLLVWAALYLPGLGTLEIKGEEGRRALPGLYMLESGNYIVPHVGGEPYLRKPPLVNWASALSFKLFRTHNEWTARLPSAFAVLAVALGFLAWGTPAIGRRGAFYGALIWLTSVGILEKGRLIEIEALYVSLTGLAFLCWLAGFVRALSPWRYWPLAGLFLGLAFLTKGPLHLFFFYGVAIPALFFTGRWRELFHPAHLLAVAITVGLFAAWAIPALQATHAERTADLWVRQFSGRLAGEGTEGGGWIFNIPKGLVYFLPWLLLIPWVKMPDPADPMVTKVNRALVVGGCTTFLVVCLIPGALPRYIMPLLVPFAWWLGSQLGADAFTWRQWPQSFSRYQISPHRIAIGIIAAVVAIMLVYGFAVVPRLQARAKIRPVARAVEAAVPAGEVLYAVAPGYQPFFFYLERPVRYLRRTDEVPGAARFLLVRAPRKQPGTPEPRWGEEILRQTDYRGETIVIFRAKTL